MAARKTKAPTFEQGLEQLEGIAAQMERSELPLDELIRLYEEGMKLSRELTKKLDEVEGRMQEVHADAEGKAVVQPSQVVQQGSLLDDLNE